MSGVFQESCGPTSALGKLNSHVGSDRSLQQSVGRPQQGFGGLNEFRSKFQVDEFVQSDFQRFGSQQNGNINGLQFQPQPIQHPQQPGSMMLQRPEMDIGEFQAHMGAQYQQPVQVQNQYQHEQAYQGQHQQNQFQQNQFQQKQRMHHMQSLPNQQVQQLQQSQNQNQLKTQPAWVTSFQNLQLEESWDEPIHKLPMFESRVYDQGLGVAQEQNLQPQQQVPVQSHDSLATDFTREFDALESELQKPASQEQQTKDFEAEKIKLAEIARNVFTSMTTGTSTTDTISKFQNSNFLKLMEKVAQRQVEINPEGNKFIDQNGNDIRDLLPDPLRDIKEAAEPFQSANEAQPGLRPSQWEEVFDDA
ncbi:unnamed protein product [Kuraishia capsulata CBS 1993]|uniref:Peroxin-20 n=1 Tax=Kuraishia capsulata CBS 1993 TaxID=1382522 RepID=W6MXB2_9ASCO|nr:uncharacterized protein KUCA_T00004568001 [Kuraishia capsulata CBS 1993]CDK28585.1 unnamed protein product [Kuraishia capsulata CBS 1993]